MAVDPILNYRDLRFDDAGRPYYTTVNGKRSYLDPSSAAQEAAFFLDDSPEKDALLASRGRDADTVARLVAYAVANGITPTNPFNTVPGGTFMRSRGVWNPATGQYDTSLNQSGILGLIEGATAVAGAAVIGPVLTGSPTIFATTAAAPPAAVATGASSSAVPAGSVTAAAASGGALATATRVATTVAGALAATRTIPQLPAMTPTLAASSPYLAASTANTWLTAAVLAAAVILIVRRHG